MTQIAFDRETFVGEVAKLQALVDAIKTQRGSAAKRLQEATETALGQAVTFVVDDVPKPFDVITHDEHGSAILGDVAVYVQALTEWAEQIRNETVSAIVKADGLGDRLDVLKAQYENGRTYVDAMRVLLAAAKVDVSDIETPSVGRGGGRPAGTRTTGTKSFRFYRVENGIRKDQSDQQNSLSSFAFYHGAKITGVENSPTNNGKGVPVGTLKSFLKSHEINAELLSTPWAIDVDGVTYGLDVRSNSDEEE